MTFESTNPITQANASVTTTPTPKILVIIVTWNKKSYILDLLASLTCIDYPLNALDILVVDNASEDDTLAAINAAYPYVTVISNEENLGGTGGFNRGLQWAFEQPAGKYQYLWLLDNDVLVHRRALAELVALLEAKPDAAVAGSTMMQLDYPWRVNEMGAFIDRHSNVGHLLLHRHLEIVPAWQGLSPSELLKVDADLTQHLMHCQPFMDVEYVAAASLLVRAEVAKAARLWRDYFIHYDDVEWCLRIANMGYRVMVSAKSIIWHLSAIAKIPTWVLYYDNRNMLDLLKQHGVEQSAIRRVMRYILKKAVYYHLLGKADLAQLHYEAIADFKANCLGKKKINLTTTAQKNSEIEKILLDPTIKRILLSWSVNVHATGIQEALVRAQLQRPELVIECMSSPNGEMIYQLPRPKFIQPFSRYQLIRWWNYWKLRGCYDLVIQSDYQGVIGLSWLKSKLLFINDDNFSQRQPPKIGTVFRAIIHYYLSYFWI